MGRTITIKLDQETKDFYHNMFLARKMSNWIDEFKALHTVYFDDDIEDMTDKEILQKLSDKKYAKNHLSALSYEEYLKYYDEVYIRR